MRLGEMDYSVPDPPLFPWTIYSVSLSHLLEQEVGTSGLRGRDPSGTQGRKKDEGLRGKKGKTEGRSKR